MQLQVNRLARGDPAPGNLGKYSRYIVYGIDLYQEITIANLTASMIGNVFGFKTLQTAQGPPPGIVVYLALSFMRRCDRGWFRSRALEKAMGGVLFIDEVYYLHRPDNERDYGQATIDFLVQFMENPRDDLMTIERDDLRTSRVLA